MNRVKHFLSGKPAGIIAVLIASAAINCRQIVLDNFASDNAFIIAAARNLAEGHGYSIKVALISDLANCYYAPLNKWPPGYSWMLVCIHKFSGTDWLHAAYLLNGIALTAVVIVFGKLLFQLNILNWFVPVAVLCFGFIEHAFLSSFADIPGLLFYLTGLSLLLYYLESKYRRAWAVILAAAAFSFSAYLKYLYLPLAFIPHFCLFWYGIKLKRKEIRQTALIGIVILFLFTGGLLLYLHFHSGQAYYFNPTQTGFYPEQLFRPITVIPASFMNLNFYNVQISLHSHISYPDMELFWAILNGGCLIWLTYAGWIAFKQKGFWLKGKRSFYAIQACFVSGALFIFLAALTVHFNKYYSLRRPDWVYLQETRYYAVFCIFVLQFVVYLLLSGKDYLGKKGIIAFRLFMVLIMSVEVSHGVYYFFKKIGIEKKYGIERKSEKIDLRALTLTKQELSKSKNVVVCSNSEEIVNVCGFSEAATFQDIRLLPAHIPASHPLMLITVIDTNIPYLFPPYFRTTDTKLEYEYSGVYYYTSKIPKTAKD